MAVERTFSIIKPDATKRNLTGAINAIIEKAGLRIVAQKRVRITREQAETFYGVHRERPFFGELVEFMTSGPVVVQVLEGEGAIAITLSRLITISATVTIHTACQSVSPFFTLSSSPPASSATSLTATHSSRRPPTSFRNG